MRPPRNGLPAPSAEERELSGALVRRIQTEIETKGALDFSRFMELALYAPGLGYYAAGRQKFGEAGDFITAPEISPLFARCVARPCAQTLASLAGGAILEAGGGSGALAADLLAELDALGALPAQYLILELSADLRARQAERVRSQVPHLAARVHWLDALPATFRGVVLANELLDAMPATRFTMTAGGPRRMGVGVHEGEFCWQPLALMPEMAPRFAPLALPVGFTSEVGLHAEAWVRSVGDMLEQGLLLLIDYGFPRREFYHPERAQGTLMCHYRHHAHSDPLRLVGLQDITAHVDFTAIAEAGQDAGLSVLGYTSQAAFLLETGLAEFAGASNAEDTRAHLALTTAVKKLTLPSEMGELFKVMALGRGIGQPAGFSLQDRRHRL